MRSRWFRRAEIIDALASLAERFGFWALVMIGSLSSGSVFGWAASASEWLNQYGPIAWAISAFLGAFLFLGLVWLWTIVRLRRAERQYIDSRKPIETAVNLVNEIFQEEKITVQDFEYLPHKMIKAKKFVRCHIIGPAAISFVGGTIVSPRYHNCEWIKVRDDFKATNIIGFEKCILTECLFINLTIFVQESAASKLEQMMKVPWLNLDEK